MQKIIKVNWFSVIALVGLVIGIILEFGFKSQWSAVGFFISSIALIVNLTEEKINDNQ